MDAKSVTPSGCAYHATDAECHTEDDRIAAEAAVLAQPEEYGYGPWAGPGVTPTPGERYEFEDFIGARFVATVRAFSSVFYPDEPVGERRMLRIEFEDRQAFETNLPVRFRELAQ